MELNEAICMVIAFAGESRSNSVKAIEEAKRRNYKESEELLKKAESSYAEAHNRHRDILTMSAQENSNFELSYLLVHMSDIMMSAELMLDMAKNLKFIIMEVRHNG